MPIYEYVCRGCGHGFEALVFGGERPECPSCRGQDLEKKLSAFAVGHGGPFGGDGPAPGPCGSCGDPRGPGACRLDDGE